MLALLVVSMACRLPLLGNIMTPPPEMKPQPTPVLTPVFGSATLTAKTSARMTEIATFASDDHHPIAALAFAPDARELVAVHGLSGQVMRWRTADATLLKTVNVGHVGMAAAAFDGSGVLLAIGEGRTRPADEAGYSTDLRATQVWNTLTGEKLWQEFIDDDFICCANTDVVMSQDGRRIAYTSAGGYDLIEVADDRRIGGVAVMYMEPTRQDGPTSITAVALDPSGDWLAWAHDGGMITIEKYDNSEAWQLLLGTQESPLALAIDPSRRYLVAVTTESMLVWRLQSWSKKPVWQRVHPYTPAAGVAFSPDGQLLAVAAETGWQMYSVKDGHLLVQHKVPAYAIAFSPDGRLFAVGDREGIVHLWGAPFQ